jgi:uncharacterized protein (DUF4415 family)
MNKRLNPELIDDENPEWTDETLKQSVRFDALPESLQDKLRGRPKSESPKQSLTIRYDAVVVSAFKATGKGWQTRMNDALKDWLKTHSPA